MRREPDRRHLVVPVICRRRSKEHTRRLERLLVKGRARILSITLTEQRGAWGRLDASVATIVAHTTACAFRRCARFLVLEDCL